MDSILIFFVNGKKIVDKNIDPEWTLLYYLRKKLRLCGTKLGCSEGGCGTCTVMVSKYDHTNDIISHLPVNACLAPICSMHGLAVTTVEGIGSTKTRLHPVQERIAKAHGSQCGFCTPGIVMSMYTLLRSMPKPSMEDMEIAFQGNLCRCTGYRPIIEGYKTFTEDWELMQTTNKLNNGYGCGMGDKCCKLNANKSNHEEEALFQKSEFIPYDASQEPIFPPELRISNALDMQALYFKGKNVAWHRPTNLQDLLQLKTTYSDAKIIVGNTEVGVDVKFKNCLYPVLIQPILIKELTNTSQTNEGVQIGASVTLMNLEELLNEQIKTFPEYKTRIFKAIVDMLKWFGSKQIRSVAAIGGNIMTGSPISDLNPIFMAANVELELQSIEGTRKIRMDEHFFTGYRQNMVKKQEVLVSITIPYTQDNQHFYAYKQARRREDDIAIVNCAINILFKENTNIIANINLAFGGMASTTVMALKTKANLIGLVWDEAMLDKAYTYLLEDLPLVANAPGGMVEYRRALPLSFFFRIYVIVCQKLQNIFPHIKVDPKDLSAIEGFKYKVPKSSQYFHVVPETQEATDTVGRPIVHMAAFKQATGEAVYCDDIPSYENELYLALVYSTTAHANIKSIDASEALLMEGVIGFICAKDISEENNKIGLMMDEEIFISKTVLSQYQVLGAIIAENQFIARNAVKKVIIVYEELTPVIISIQDAIKSKSFLKTDIKLEVGDVDAFFKNAKHVIEGECRTGYQEHFYLETQSSLVVPTEDGLEIFCSSQYQAAITSIVAKVLDLPQNKIVTRIKRVGGAFGGKENRWAIATLPAAIAARKYNRPIRISLERDEDMLMTGGRDPYYSKYKAAFDENGKILAYDVISYLNGGYSYETSHLVMEHGLFHIDNSYKIDNLRATGKVCKTNLPSNTVFRGSGSPQSMFVTEYMVRDVAEYLKKDSIEVALLNLYKEGDTTHYNQAIENCNIRKCIEECLESSKYYERKKEIEKYNSENRWKKRGISIVTDTYGVGFGASGKFLEQAGCLVLVYTDGSVLLTHGGIEMGQGLHTKMIQIASRVLQIPVDKIHTSECATDKVPNTAPSAASVSSDLNGEAVIRACQIIIDRLEPIKAKNPKGTWDDWIKAAYFERISLSATGFYKTPIINEFNNVTKSGDYFNYFTFGAACTEVEIDCLTGDHQVLRTDIVMDLGESINPAIDVGQIEGGFMQGYGLFVLEEMVYSPKGDIYTRGPGAYKIPGFTDIPIEFNVSLLKGSSNPRAVYSSKAVGEPPLFLASSVLFAIREAIKSARADAGLVQEVRLDAPATAAKIRMACQDHLTAKVYLTTEDVNIPWNVPSES